jgi:hypothetical protein
MEMRGSKMVQIFNLTYLYVKVSLRLLARLPKLLTKLFNLKLGLGCLADYLAYVTNSKQGCYLG